MYEKIKENIYYMGVIDRSLKVFDVIMETKYGTSYNSYLVKTKNHVILIDTAKLNFYDEYIETINKNIGIDKVDTIIVNHTEPDHVGSIEKMLELNPNIKIIGSKAAIQYLEDIINNTKFNHKIVKPNEEIKFDDKTFKFISAPFLHWPDSIYTYIKEDKMLFTCDSFGAHYAFDGLFLSKIKEEEKEGYLDAYKYYYDAIFEPYKNYVLKALDKIKNLEFDMICPGHGPILDTNQQFYLDTYKEWSTVVNPYDKLIVIPYATSYGYTEMMAQKITDGIKQYDETIEVHHYNVDVINYNELKEKIREDYKYADAILFGSTTINKDATPIIWSLANELNSIIHQGKIISVFGSYGWSGEGVDLIHSRFKEAKFKTLPSCKLKFKPSVDNEKILIQYGKELAEGIYKKSKKFTTMKNNKIIIQ